MEIGQCRVCLTPKKEFYLIGRNASRFLPAIGVHDDIYANAILFKEQDKEVFLFQADFIEFEEEMVEEVKTILQNKFGIQRDLILFSATHNHSSVVSYHKHWYTNKFDQSYYDFLLGQILKCYENCKENAQRAYAKIGRQQVIGYYGSRIYPGKPADNEVIVIKFFNQQHKVFASIVNWAVHSNVVSSENRYLSGDLAGRVCFKLHKYWDHFPTILVGAAGDCTTENQRKARDFAELERMSSGLAEIISKIPVEHTLSLKDIFVQTVYHTIHHSMDFVHREVKQVLETEKNQDRIEEVRQLLQEKKFHLDVKSWVIQIGELVLFVFPGEFGSSFGKQLKQQAKSHALVLGYTNGYYGYFMPKETYGLSFVTDCTRIPKNESEKIIEKLLKAQK